MDLPLGVRQLVAEAALQPPAQSGELRGIQAEILLLGHLDRDGLERRQEGRAAQGAAAGAVAPEHLGLVPHPDLPHLDTGLELRRELPDQLAKVDARIRREVENEPGSVEGLLDARELHRESPLAT